MHSTNCKVDPPDRLILTIIPKASPKIPSSPTQNEAYYGERKAKEEGRRKSKKNVKNETAVSLVS